MVEAANATFDRSAIARAEFVGGNFFTAVPNGAALHLMKSILDEWNDDDCQRILMNVVAPWPDMEGPRSFIDALAIPVLAG